MFSGRLNVSSGVILFLKVSVLLFLVSIAHLENVELVSIVIGQHLPSKRLMVRLVAGAWCVGCFFLVQIYSSTLTSYLMASNEKPIADSIIDLADNPKVSVFVEKGLALEVVFKVYIGNYIGTYRFLWCIFITSMSPH